MGAGVGVVVDLPGLLTGALAVPVTRELAFGTAGLGAAIASIRATAAVASVPAGRLADRIGAVHSLRLTVALAAVSTAGIATFARSWTLLTAGLVVSGAAIAIGHPAANRLLSRTVPARRHGTAFGVKQAAPPTASLLAGVSVPVVALTVGWRWAFLLAAIVAVLMLLAIGRRPAPAPPPAAGPVPDAPVPETSPPPRRGPRAGMVWLGSGFAFGTASAVVIPAFFVDAAVNAGSPVDSAGALLAFASAATITVRVAMGFVADRMATGHFGLCGTLLAVGTVGLALLGTGDPTWMAVGVVIGASMLWGFNGVFWSAVVRIGGRFPATITGLMSPGGHIGGSLGPLAFGILAAAIGYPAAWLVWAVLGVAAAASMFAAARSLSPRRSVW